MPRGRPKSILKIPTTTLEERVAEYLHTYCMIPGCITKIHAEDARNIIAIVRKKDGE